MKHEHETKVSRRKFLEAAVVTAAAAKTVSAEPPPVDTERKRLEALVENYGSEFGDLRKVR
ncbi:MAG: hypothetical protein BMS9Abin37_0725 [Acidobacteriota bacterium]|nr:MAG: hypothetical protein BMS9Abin37_0725 [Acidobacteriota bacterium]